MVLSDSKRSLKKIRTHHPFTFLESRTERSNERHAASYEKLRDLGIAPNPASPNPGLGQPDPAFCGLLLFSGDNISP
jgi:hypothetical protein